MRAHAFRETHFTGNIICDRCGLLPLDSEDSDSACPRTLAELRDEILANLDETYDLVFVAYDDKLTDEQTAALVRGDFEAIWDSTDEWTCDSSHEGAKYHIAEHLADAIRTFEAADDDDYTDLSDSFEFSAEYDEVRELIMDRDAGQWFDELIGNTPDPLLRVPLVDEDHALEPSIATPADVLTACGLPHTPGNVQLANDLLANVPSSVGMIYALATVDLAVVNMIPSDAFATITGPHLLMGNPFAGAYHAEGPFEGSVSVERDDLRTDRDAFGCSWDECAGLASVSYYAAEIAAAQIEVAA